MEKQLYKITEMSPIDALYEYRFTFIGVKGCFQAEDVDAFASGFLAGTFTFVPPIKRVGAIKNMKSATFVAIKVEPI
jgi:hypothetical protein